MTSLMGWVRRADVRRGTSGVAAVALLCAVAGCEDRASNTGDTQPIAVTESGVEILKVVRDENRRTVEAVVVTGGEERQVTFEPTLDGPLPFGMSARVSPNDGSERIQLAFGWDEHSGAAWVRQTSGDDSLELTRYIVQGRVVEEYVFNGQALLLQYANLSDGSLDKAADMYARGELFESTSPDVVEFGTQIQLFESFAAQLPSSFIVPNSDGELLTSLLGDPVFVSTVTGEFITHDNLKKTLCSSFNTCAAIACRIYPLGTICGVCVAGSLACLFTEWFCLVMCGG